MKAHQYLPNEAAWLLELHGYDAEFLVHGSVDGPEQSRLECMEQAASDFTAFVNRATSYLDEFVDRERFANRNAWHLEGMRSSPPTEKVDEISLQFSIEGDEYGYWFVKFGRSSGRFWPIEMTRQQK